LPQYSYFCEKCSNVFELFFSIGSYTDSKQKCPECHSSCSRSYSTDLSTLSSSVKKSDSELKTIGHLANRNRDRMTEDQKTILHEKHNDYKEVSSDKPLPSGMSRIKKPNRPKWPT
jgi:putative FmdB family regulatory protein